MSGCDGWCPFCKGRAVIRINTRLVKSRQRFTLAHELGRLLLDVPSVIGESFSDVLRSDDAEERRVNEVAANGNTYSTAMCRFRGSCKGASGPSNQ
jgi:Zn-dependent peptidase ImmA (M78 family)